MQNNTNFPFNLLVCFFLSCCSRLNPQSTVGVTGFRPISTPLRPFCGRTASLSTASTPSHLGPTKYSAQRPIVHSPHCNTHTEIPTTVHRREAQSSEPGEWQGGVALIVLPSYRFQYSRAN